LFRCLPILRGIGRDEERGYPFSRVLASQSFVGSVNQAFHTKGESL
jgi:hypothetical protein